MSRDFRQQSKERGIPDVLWVGRMFSTMGYGSHSRNSLLALSSADIKYIAFDSGTGEQVGPSSGVKLKVKKYRDRNVVTVDSNKKLLVVFNEIPLKYDKVEVVGNVRLVALTVFETASVPHEWIEYLDRMDEIWVPTSFNIETFSNAGLPKEKLRIVPECIDTDLFDGSGEPLVIPGRRNFVFLYVFTTVVRKDIGLLLRSYYRAFKGNDDVTLVLKTLFDSEDDPIVQAIKDSVKPEFDFDDPELPSVVLMGEDLHPERMKRLYKACDVYATSERAKGWDLPAMEAMAMGKPVVTIDWSGSTEFIHKDNAFLIPTKTNLTPVPPQLVAQNPWYCNHMWAHVEEEDVEAALRRAYEKEDLRREYGERGQKEVRATYSYKASGKQIRDIISTYDDDDFKARGATQVTINRTPQIKTSRPGLEQEIRDEITRAFHESYSWKIGSYLTRNAKKYLGWTPLARKRAEQEQSEPTEKIEPAAPAHDPSFTVEELVRLKTLHNKFMGERIFILGNGPSLNKTPLHLLKDEYTFCVNRIQLLFDRIDWRPNFYLAFDNRVIEDNKDEINALDIEYKFFATKYKPVLGECESNYWFLDNPRYTNLEERFEPDVYRTGFGGGGCVISPAIQIAFYLGFDPIYIIGVDADYKVLSTVKQSGPDRFGDGILLELESTQDDDPNHFDPRYFGKGKKWHNPNVPEMIRGFLNCRLAVDKHERHIYNATVGGKLFVMDRVDFTSLFENGSA